MMASFSSWMYAPPKTWSICAFSKPLSEKAFTASTRSVLFQIGATT